MNFIIIKYFKESTINFVNYYFNGKTETKHYFIIQKAQNLFINYLMVKYL
jgi:hypothetical protein